LTHCVFEIRNQGARSSLKWSYTTGKAIRSSPAVAGGMVYIGSQDGYVYVYAFSPE